MDQLSNMTVNDKGQKMKTNGTATKIKMPGEKESPKTAKKGLIEEIGEIKVIIPEPEYSLDTKEADGSDKPQRLVLKVKLTGVTSVTECDLDISDVSSTVIIDKM